MSPDLALSVFENAPREATMLDPMCGSGTALRAAAEHGLRAVGFDIDPLAVLMAKVWTTPVDARLLLRSADLAVRRSRGYDPRKVTLPWISDDPETRDYVDYWFGKPQQRQLRCLVTAIRKSQPEFRDALRLALSRTIITKDSGASLARDVSHSRPHKVKEFNDFDVNDAFISAANRIARQLEAEPPPRRVRVEMGDARCLRDVRTRSIDLILTSPPYLNAIDYMRGHRLSLVWLGYTVGALRALRASSIGSERAPAAGYDEALLADLMTLVSQRIASLSPRTRRVFEHYLLDVYSALSEIARVLRRGGRAVFVIGNSTVEGVFVSNADALTAAATRVGLRFVERYERELPSNRRYLPPPSARRIGSLGLRMRTESVITFSTPR